MKLAIEIATQYSIVSVKSQIILSRWKTHTGDSQNKTLQFFLLPNNSASTSYSGFSINRVMDRPLVRILFLVYFYIIFSSHKQFFLFALIN